jgi:hypothetical protein
VSAERDRKLERAREALAEKDEEARAKAKEQQIGGANRTQDEQDVRAKNAGPGKKTADKWNQ